MRNEDVVFKFVAEHPGCIPKEIVVGTMITPVNQVNQKLSKLRERELIYREPHGRTFRYYPQKEASPVRGISGHSRQPNIGSGNQQVAVYSPENTLIVVSCTKTKIWIDVNRKEETYIQAQDAYKGRGDWFQKWKVEQEQKWPDFPWLILSAKYGFIEPEHPIHNYNVTFNDATTGPISDESLANQACYQERFFRNGIVKKICQFDYVCVKGSKVYLDKVKRALANMRTIVKPL